MGGSQSTNVHPAPKVTPSPLTTTAIPEDSSTESNAVNLAVTIIAPTTTVTNTEPISVATIVTSTEPASSSTESVSTSTESVPVSSESSSSVLPEKTTQEPTSKTEPAVITQPSSSATPAVSSNTEPTASSPGPTTEETTFPTTVTTSSTMSDTPVTTPETIKDESETTPEPITEPEVVTSTSGPGPVTPGPGVVTPTRGPSAAVTTPAPGPITGPGVMTPTRAPSTTPAPEIFCPQKTLMENDRLFHNLEILIDNHQSSEKDLIDQQDYHDVKQREARTRFTEALATKDRILELVTKLARVPAASVQKYVNEILHLVDASNEQVVRLYESMTPKVKKYKKWENKIGQEIMDMVEEQKRENEKRAKIEAAAEVAAGIALPANAIGFNGAHLALN